MKYFNKVYLTWAVLSAVWLGYWLWQAVYDWVTRFDCVPSHETACLSRTVLESETYRAFIFFAELTLIAVYGVGVPLAVLLVLMIGLWALAAVRRRRALQS